MVFIFVIWTMLRAASIADREIEKQNRKKISNLY